MEKKVILITVDGMRPDGFLACGNPYGAEMMKKGSYTLAGASVVPPVTLPCHLSLFQSVQPVRHGVLTNTYIPPVHAINGLFEQLHNAGKTAAMFYAWEPIRQVSTPKSLTFAEYAWAYALESADTYLTRRMLECIRQYAPDFLFLHMVETDEKGGHDNGWMTQAYLDRISIALDNIRRILETCGDRYDVIVTADHGGHDRTHGLDIPEDMTIPMFFFDSDFEPGAQLENVGLLDLAPTIAKLIGVPPAREWEGRSIV